MADARVAVTDATAWVQDLTSIVISPAMWVSAGKRLGLDRSAFTAMGSDDHIHVTWHQKEDLADEPADETIAVDRAASALKRSSPAVGQHSHAMPSRSRPGR